MIKILLILLLLIIFVQDMKIRAVYWFMFPILLAFSFWIGIETNDLTNMGWNVLFFTFLMGFLTLYLSLKQGHLVNITKGYFSLGDMFFLVAIIPLLTFPLYLLFFTIGTLMTLVVHGVVVSFSKQSKTIPFAGYMALFLVAYLVFDNQINNLIIRLI